MDQLSDVKIQWLSRTVSEAKLCFSHISNSQDISGQIRGPFCRYSRTLPSNHRINNGQAVVVDPCYWTPKLPFYYEVTLESSSLSEPLKFTYGLRWCIAHRGGLRLNGNGYVFRAIKPKVNEIDLEQIRDASASLIVSAIDEQLFKDASELGVMIGLMESCDASLETFPAVHFKLSDKDVPSDVLSIRQDDASKTGIRLTEEYDVTECVNYREQMPWFIVRRGCSGSLADLRMECDRLQRDMARFGQFAGYLIDAS